MVRRAQKAGWRTEKSNDGWMVWDANGRKHPVHLTNSDTNALHQKLRDWEAGGLLEAEAKVAQEAAEQKRIKLAEGRALAAEKAKRLSARADLTNRASGPYRTQIDECDLDWLIGEHPAPWMRWMYITPDVASKLLLDHNTGNRTISSEAVNRYRLIILSGQWHLTHQGIAIDTTRVVQDGQHRLAAVAAAGEDDPDLKLPFAVFVGMPPENFKAIDEGRLRTASQMLKMSGVGGAAHVVTVLRAVAGYDSPNPKGFHKGVKLGNAQTFDIYDKHGVALSAAASYGNRQYKKTGVTPGALGAAWYLIGRVNGFTNPYFVAFFEGFCNSRKYGTQLVLPDDDPRKVLQGKLRTAGRINPLETAILFIHAWNNMVSGHHPRYMRNLENSELPRPLLCVPGQGAVPRGFAGEDLEVPQ